jgi:DUF4097 and DUF4098 domain-containing protein YvlB
MMRLTTSPLSRSGALALAIAIAGPGAAAAQTLRLEVNVQVPPETARAVERSADATGRVAARAARSALAEMDPWLAFSAGAAQQGRDGRAERTDRTSQTIALGPTGLLELRNVSGDITVTAGSGRDVVLEVVKRARGRTDADVARGFEEVRVAIEHRGERATVETVYPQGRRSFDVNTTYTVTAPAGTRIIARSVSGNATVRGIKGDVSVEVVSGNVAVSNAGRVSQARSLSGNVRLTDIESDGVVTAGTVSGNLDLERVRARRLAADNVSGNIRVNDANCDSAQLKSMSGLVEYVGQIARNGRYELESHSGPVRFIVDGNVGFEFQGRSFSGRIQPEGLSFQGVSMNRGQMRATVGDGSAVVVAQSFSGNVVVGKR